MGKISMGLARAGTARLSRIFLSRKNSANKKTAALREEIKEEDVLPKMLEYVRKETLKFIKSVRYHKDLDSREINEKLIFFIEHFAELKTAVETLKKERGFILPKDMDQVYEEINKFNPPLADAFGEGVALFREKTARKEIV